MDEVIKLEPRNIREVWDEVKPGLEEIKRTWPEGTSWRVEDVYAAVLAEEAVLYTSEDGFAVCTLDTDKYTGESDLYIWIAYSYEDKRGGMLSKYLPSFIEVAKHLGCKGVTTVSNHPALVTHPDLESVYTTYRVAIDESA
jgi:hypothetical protein